MIRLKSRSSVPTLATPRERHFALSLRQSFKRRNFTLVELLIAAAITVVIVVMLGLMLGSLMTSASHASQRVDAFRDARAALQMMERDLSNLVRAQWDIQNHSRSQHRDAAYQLRDQRLISHSINAGRTGKRSLLRSGEWKPKSPDICADCDRKRSQPPEICVQSDIIADGTPTSRLYPSPLFSGYATTTFNVFTSPAVTAANYVARFDLYAPISTDEVLAAYVWNLNITIRDATGLL